MVREPPPPFQCKIIGAYLSSHINSLSLFSKQAEFLDPCQDGTNASVCRDMNPQKMAIQWN